MHIFNNIILALKPNIIKAFPKSDMAVIWDNIWDLQNRTTAKSIINQHFNVRQYIATICGMNMNFRVPVRRGSHRGGSPQNGLRDEQTCGTTLASADVLCRLSAAWSQLQMKRRKSE